MIQLVWPWIAGGLLLALVVAGIRYWCLLRAGFAFETSQLSPPFRIHLVEARDTSWTRMAAVAALADQLQEIGFTEAGVFEIQEMPGIKARGFVCESTGVSAMVFAAGEKLWVDMESYYADGSSIGYSTASVGAELPRPSNQPQIWFPDLPLANLHHRLVTDRPRGILRPISRDRFAGLLEENYADHQNWLAERGGYTTPELRSLIPAGAKLTVEQLETIREKVAREALTNWCRLQTEARAQTDAPDDCVAIIHDEMSLDQVLLTYSRMTGDWDADAKHIPPHAKSRPRAAFEALNEAREGGLVQFLQKTTPLCADYYRNEATPPNESGRNNR